MELESSLQQAYYFAARYLGIDPPTSNPGSRLRFLQVFWVKTSAVIGQLRAEGALIKRHLPRYSQIRRNNPRSK